MSVDFVSLAQALSYLKKPAPFLSEDAFSATANVRSLPKDKFLRIALVSALVRGDVAHKGKLTVVEWSYGVDHRGSSTRTDVEAISLEPNFEIASDQWHLDRVDFFQSSLDLDEWLTEFKVRREDFEEPWMQVRNIMVSTTDLAKLSLLGDAATAKSRGGRPPAMAFWRQFYADVVAKVAQD